MSGEEAKQINQKFKTQIRKRQRQQIMKRGRQTFLEYQKMQEQKMKGQIVQNVNIDYNQLNSNIKNINSIFSKEKLIEQVPNNQVKKILLFLISDQSLQVIDTVNLLSKFIQYCGSLYPPAQPKIKIIRQVLEQSNLQEKLFELVHKNIQSVDHNKLKMYLFCLKNMALIRMQKVIKKELLQKYLPAIIQNFITEASVLIIMAYVSQLYPFSPDIILKVCDQAHSKQKITKIAVSTILTNYVSTQESRQNIKLIFDKLLYVLQYLYLNSKQFGQRFSKPLLQSFMVVISKFPDQMPEQLLKRISNCKIQDMFIVLLSVSSTENKSIVFMTQETIIDKTIHDLRQKFFSQFSLQIIYQVAFGLQQTSQNIIHRCLKILNKVFHYAPRNIIQKVQSQTNIKQALEDLVYHKNPTIATMAQTLQKYFENDDEMKIEEQ